MKFKKVINEEVNVSELVKGETYTVPSGMGGVFTVKYLGMEKGFHKFQSLTKGWDKGIWKYHYVDEKDLGNINKK